MSPRQFPLERWAGDSKLGLRVRRHVRAVPHFWLGRVVSTIKDTIAKAGQHGAHRPFAPVAAPEPVAPVARFTAGPWMAAGAYIEHLDDRVPDIAHFILKQGDLSRSDGEARANARLCAEAPSMLAKLRDLASECANCGGTGVMRCVSTHGVNTSEPCDECADIRAVIARAEGRS